jgi:hypothetical protein
MNIRTTFDLSLLTLYIQHKCTCASKQKQLIVSDEHNSASLVTFLTVDDVHRRRTYNASRSFAVCSGEKADQNI